MFSIDTRSRAPIYVQLAGNITALAASGALLPDEQLPGVRSLARELGVNPNTVSRAYQELENQGIIYQAAGRGSFISPAESFPRPSRRTGWRSFGKAWRTHGAPG
jgi:GntR family transcriptional regulator